MTARVSISDERMQIQRAGFARWLGPSVDVSLSHVVSVAPADPGQVRRWNKGIRLAGIEIPRLLTWGVYRQGGRVTWWDIGRGDGALLVTLRDEKLDAVVLQVEDPAELALALHRAVARPDESGRADRSERRPAG